MGIVEVVDGRPMDAWQLAGDLSRGARSTWGTQDAPSIILSISLRYLHPTAAFSVIAIVSSYRAFFPYIPFVSSSPQLQSKTPATTPTRPSTNCATENCIERQAPSSCTANSGTSWYATIIPSSRLTLADRLHHRSNMPNARNPSSTSRPTRPNSCAW